MKNIDFIKAKFPIFKNYSDLVFLDNASTTQKPQIVIDELKNYYEKYNANVHRGLYWLSEESTDIFENARKKIADFINAEYEGIIFTSGATEGLNLIVQSLLQSNLIKTNSSILLSEMEHHSNIVPWQSYGFNIDYLALNDTFAIEVSRNKQQQYDVLSINLGSNVTGFITDFKKLKENFKAKFTVIDASQIIGHRPVDIKELNPDFLVFSGHKMYGPMGIGILYIKKDLHNKLVPAKKGGGMIKIVGENESSWAEAPAKFEAGTPSVADASALSKAIEFIQDIGWTNIIEHENNLRLYTIGELQKLDFIKLYHPSINQDALGVMAFSINNIHAHDISQYLAQYNICVRAGHHCTQILHKKLNCNSSTRLSIGIYNEKNDIDIFVSKMKEMYKFFYKQQITD